MRHKTELPLSLTSASFQNPRMSTTDTHRHMTATRGFVAWVLLWFLFSIFVLWTLLSDENLRWLGVTYYPARYWAVAAPGLFAMGLYYYLTTNFLTYVQNTKPFSDIHCLTDEHAKGEQATLGTLLSSDGLDSIPPISDVPASVTSKVLYQPWYA